MKKLIYSFLTILSCAVLCLSNSVSTFAEVQLPDGAVKGLPEKLTVMDSNGNSVNSATGEYFFHVENMIPNQTYSKDIQIMNLREDKAYHIYFYAEPLSKSGDIDLENECTAVISLGGNQVYEGKVTGKGNIDLTSNPIDLGLYTPGDAKILNCEITWDGSSINEFIDYGERLVDTNGTTIIRKGDEDAYIYGEVTFKWIFYAVVDETYNPPKTGILGNKPSLIYVIILCICLILIIIMIVLIMLKKSKKKLNNSKDID
ncbi:MAG: hypothetical protein ACI4WH_05255 [Oscillospiraceae bacterium]